MRGCARLLGQRGAAGSRFRGDPREAVWLPNEAVAKAWMDYVKTGAVGDGTPPPAPRTSGVTTRDGGTEVTWRAEADFESGIGAFVALRDRRELAKVPQKPVGKFGRPLFQSMTYHDTPDPAAAGNALPGHLGQAGQKHAYAVITVNSVGLRSEPSAESTQVRAYRFDGTIRARSWRTTCCA